MGESNILIPDDSQANDQFGCSVDIGDFMSVIGAKHNPTSDKSKSGTAYIYSRNNLNNWLEMKPTPVSIEATLGDEYGMKVVINKELTKNLDGIQRILVSAWKKDSPTDSGRVYVYNLEEASTINQTIAYNQRTQEWGIENLPSPPQFSSDLDNVEIGQIMVYNGNEWTRYEHSWKIGNRFDTFPVFEDQLILTQSSNLLIKNVNANPTWDQHLPNDVTVTDIQV